MKTYLNTYKSVVSDSQKLTLNSFLEKAKTQALSLAPTDPEELLKNIGEKLFSVPDTPTDPDQYNKAIIAAIADLTALYAEIDNVGIGITVLEKLNSGELARISKAIDNIENMVKARAAMNKNILNYTDIVYEDFTADNGDSTIIPTLYRKLEIDKTDNALKRPIAGSISKTISAGNRKMCKVTIEKLLGASIDTLHPVSEAVDGSKDTCWKETILSDSPIAANRNIVNWLPASYSGGSAAKLRFEFDFMTPITEISLSPVSSHPMRLLEVAWSPQFRNTKDTGSIIPINGNFSDNLVGWVTTETSETTGYITSLAGYDGSQCLEIHTATATGSSWKISRNLQLNPSTLYGISFYMKRSSSTTQVKLTASMIVDIPVGTVHSKFWEITPSEELLYSNEWQEAIYNFQTPSLDEYLQAGAITSGIALTFEISDIDYSETLLDDIQLSNDYYVTTFDEIITDKTTLKFTPIRGGNIVCKTLWLTLSQPHYTLKHYTISNGALDLQDLWEQTLLPPNSDILTYNNPRKRVATFTKKERKLPANSQFIIEVRKLSGKIKEMIAQLYSIALPSKEETTVVKYEYTFGASEINLKNNEYIPEGIWVSKPLDITGEIRQLTLKPTTDASTEAVNFYVTTYKNETIDTDNLTPLIAPNYTRYWKASDESRYFGPSGLTTIVAPAEITDTFNGTDRNHKISLSKFPYINIEKVADISAKIASGDMLNIARYSPNTSTVTYITSTVTSPSGVLTTIEGYKPVEVTLHFSDSIVLPDVIGNTSVTVAKFIGPESLLLDTEGTVVTEIVERMGGEPSLQDLSFWDYVDSLIQKAIEKGNKNTDRSNIIQQVQTTDLWDSNKLSRKVVEENRIVSQTYVTKYPVLSTDKGDQLDIYWHRYQDSDGNVVTDHTSDILLHPSTYSIAHLRPRDIALTKWFNTTKSTTFGHATITVNDEGFDQILSVPGVSEEKWELVAYYRTKIPADHMLRDYDLETPQTSGVGNIPTQAYPVTRNMTDYWTNSIPTLKLSNKDSSSPDYYPIYEYYIDKHGNITFADDLFKYSDTPARIEASYKTLAINPRIVIEYTNNSGDGTTQDTPSIYDYSVLLNTRR